MDPLQLCGLHPVIDAASVGFLTEFLLLLDKCVKSLGAGNIRFQELLFLRNTETPLAGLHVHNEL